MMGRDKPFAEGAPPFAGYDSEDWPRQKGQKTMAFSKEDRAKGVTSAELISCAPASDGEGELEYLGRKLECKAALIDGLRQTLDEERARISALEQENTELKMRIRRLQGGDE